ncbi:hypothetical protein BG004_002492 [Podila humilis]|nr:hypothetical protein BG004_002492 [Podila humilis]
MLRPTNAKTSLAGSGSSGSRLSGSSSEASQNQPALTQTIGHVIDGEAFVFEVPVTRNPADGSQIVLLEHVLDLFPNTVGLRLRDQTPVPFMTTTDDVLMVPMRVRYHPRDILYIIAASQPPRHATPPPPIPPRPLSPLVSPEPPALPSRPKPLPSTNPFRAMLTTSGTSSGTHASSTLVATSPAPTTNSTPFMQDDMDPFGLSSLSSALDSSSNSATSAASRPPPLPSRSRTNPKRISLATQGLAELIAKSVPDADLPIPRLFIALPDAKPRDFDDAHLAQQQDNSDTLKNIELAGITRTFRLYFLCDCGQGATFPLLNSSSSSFSQLPSTTMSTQFFDDSGDDEHRGTSVRADADNCIHIANQAGYEILNLQQFATDWGAYTLRFLYGLRDGVSKTVSVRERRGEGGGGSKGKENVRSMSQSSSLLSSRKVAIPPLDETQYTDVLQPFTWDLKERVTTAIQVLESLHSPKLSKSMFRNNSNSGAENIDDDDDQDDSDVDLTRLWEYVQGLKVGRQEQFVQSMYRMQVHDGSTRWICDAHYQSTFEYLKDDRDAALWQCKDILGDDTTSDPVENLIGADLVDDSLGNQEDGFSFSAETKALKQWCGGQRTKKCVMFDDRKKHLKLAGVENAKQVRLLSLVLARAYMIQRVSLSVSFSSCCYGADDNNASVQLESGQEEEVMAVISDMISRSRIELWDVFVHPDVKAVAAEETILAASAVTAPTSAPPPYSFDDDMGITGMPSLSSSSSSSPAPSSLSTTTLSARTSKIAMGSKLRPSDSAHYNRDFSSALSSHRKKRLLLHPLSDLFILSQINSLELPDLGKNLFQNLNPGPGDFLHLKHLKLWGSDAVEMATSRYASLSTAAAAGGPDSLGLRWNTAGMGSLLRAFSNLTELRITDIDLGKTNTNNNNVDRIFYTTENNKSDFGIGLPLMEVVQSLLYLPKLVVLELSGCGLNQTHCALLARTLTAAGASVRNSNGFDNNQHRHHNHGRITHLNIHNNWLGDEGLAELIWAVGPHLFSLDARHCGFGNASAFALASIMLAAEQDAKQQHGHQHHDSTISSSTNSYSAGTISTLKILKLQEADLEELNGVRSTTAYAVNRRAALLLSSSSSSSSSAARTTTQRRLPGLDQDGRANLVRALEIMAPLELMLSFEMGFQDEDFASAFMGMKRLDSLERLEVGYSNFGPLALQAMVRTLQATSCRIRYLGVQSTLLTEDEQKQALDLVLSI